MPAARPRPGPARLVLVRHAESLGNVADRDARSRGDARLDLHVRDADVALSPTGEQQAAAVGRYVATLPADEQPTVVLSSPYERAAATAAHALSAMDGRLQVRHDERLRERELGLFDGLTGAGIRAEFPQEADRRRYLGKFYYRPPSGESWCDVALRVRSLLARRGGPVRRRAGVGLQPPGGDHELPAGPGGARRARDPGPGRPLPDGQLLDDVLPARPGGGAGARVVRRPDRGRGQLHPDDA